MLGLSQEFRQPFYNNNNNKKDQRNLYKLQILFCIQLTVLIALTGKISSWQKKKRKRGIGFVKTTKLPEG
jgi:hypothetical protein